VVVVEPLLDAVEPIDDIGHLTAAFGAFAIVTAAGFTPSFFVIFAASFAPFWMCLLDEVWRCWS
jgi:hypothetical protein